MEGAVVLGERIRTTVEKASFSFQDQSIPVQVSIGVAVAEAADTADYDSMKHLAARALSEAKKTGRNRCVFSPIGAKQPFEAAG